MRKLNIMFKIENVDQYDSRVVEGVVVTGGIN